MKNIIMTAFFLFSAAFAVAQQIPDGFQGYSQMQNLTFRGNNLSNGDFDAKGAPALKTVKWKLKTGGKIYSSPVEAGKNVYVGSMDGNLYSADIATGAERWKFKTSGGVVSTPTVSGGLVFFTSMDGKLYAVETASGKEKWSAKVTEEKNYHASPALSYGTIFVAGGDKRSILEQAGWGAEPVKGYDALTGTKIWEQLQGKGPQGFSAVALAEGAIIFPYGFSSTAAYNLSTGEAFYEGQSSDILFNSPIYQPPAVSTDGSAYYIGRQTGDQHTNEKIGSLGILDWKTGRKGPRTAVFKDGLEKNKKATGLAEGGDYTVWTAPTLGEGKVFIGCADGNLYAFEQKTLKRSWTFKAGGPIRSSASFAKGTVYFGCDDGNLYAVDASSGRETGKCRIGGSEILSSPCISNSAVYIGSDDGFLYCAE